MHVQCLVGREVVEAETELRELEPTRHVDLVAERVVALLVARHDHVLVPEHDRPLGEVERFVHRAPERRRRTHRFAAQVLDGERRRLARLPVEVVLADRAHDRALGQRHPVRFVTFTTEQDLEVGVGSDADVGRGELGERRRVLGVAEAFPDGERELLARVHPSPDPVGAAGVDACVPVHVVGVGTAPHGDEVVLTLERGAGGVGVPDRPAQPAERLLRDVPVPLVGIDGRAGERVARDVGAE